MRWCGLRQAWAQISAGDVETGSRGKGFGWGHSQPALLASSGLLQAQESGWGWEAVSRVALSLPSGVPACPRWGRDTVEFGLRTSGRPQGLPGQELGGLPEPGQERLAVSESRVL